MLMECESERECSGGVFKPRWSLLALRVSYVSKNLNFASDVADGG